MNNQTLAALAHSFIIIILMVTFSWLGLADFPWHKTPDSIELLQIDKVPEDELPIRLSYEIKVLQMAQRIESEKIGAGAHRSEVFQAYRIILAAEEAELIFKYLLNEQNVVTKIYAMKGL